MTISLAVTGSAAGAGDLRTTIYVGRHFEQRDHDQPIKYVFNGSTRVAEVTGSLSANSRLQRVRLFPGWNLCSLAVSGPFPAGVADSISAAYQWDSSTGNYSLVADGQTLAAGTVLWIKAATNAVVSVLGTYVDPIARQVTTGGTYLSGAGLEAWVPALPSSAASWNFDAATAQWSDALTGDLASVSGPAPALSPGQAFFIQVTAPTSLEIPDPTLRVRYVHQDHLGSSSAITDARGGLIEETVFHPFGVPRHQNEPRQLHEPYQFTQKERDRESGLHYFEARYLAGRLSRFAGVDSKYMAADRLSGRDFAALLAHPQLLNLYDYVVDNPIRWTDQTGFAPGDPYKKPEEAAADALIAANPKSIAENREYGGLIYYDPGLKRYYATTPTTGTGDTFSPSRVSVPKGTVKIGDYHTHGDYTFMVQLPIVRTDASGNLVQDVLKFPTHGPKATDFYDSDHFSNTDLTGIASDATGVSGYKGYLGTPSGNFQQFDPANGNLSALSSAAPAEDPVNCRGNYTGNFPYFKVTCE